MWFITAIDSNTKNKSRMSRTFGFYNEHNDARKAVEENRCDMFEHLYDYLVIEYIESGIHPIVRMDEWYKWNDALKKWEFITDKPKQYSGYTNWALG